MAKRMNILRLITHMPVGGIERKILEVLPRLDPERFRPRVLCLREKGILGVELEKQGIPVDVCPLASRLSPSGIWTMKKYMEKNRIHVVHAHMYRASVPGTIAARLAGVPVIIGQVHNVDTWETRRQKWMDRFMSRRRCCTVAVSEKVRRNMMETLGLPAQKVRVIYNGVDTGRFDLPSARLPVRKALCLQEEDIVIVYHGRLVPQKNPERLVDIAAHFKNHSPRVTVVVAGDGASRGKMEKRASQLEAWDHIQFLGRRNDIPELLNAADIAVLPSAKEGFSNALVEAMAAGLPVIATNVGGNGEAIEHGLSGCIVQESDFEGFLKALEMLVEDPTERQRMSTAAKKRAERFSLDNMVREVENLYITLAREQGLLPDA